MGRYFGRGGLVARGLAVGGLCSSAAVGLVPGETRTLDSIENDAGTTPAHDRQTDDFFRDATDPAVERLVGYYRYNAKGRATLSAWFARAELYRPMVERTLEGYGLPKCLLAVAVVESGLHPAAVSPMGATGLWQFMQTTGRNYGLQITEELDERRQPQLATDAAARHLRDLHSNLGDWPRTLAAYNAGEERIRGVSDEVGSTNFWMMRERSTSLPRETADYVPRVFAVARLLEEGWARSPDIQEKRSRESELVSVTLPSGVHLEHVANALGVQRVYLRRINPEVVGYRVPENAGAPRLRVPKDRAHLAELLLQPAERGTNVDRELLRRVSQFSRALDRRMTLDETSFVQEQRSAAWERLVAAVDGHGQRTYRVRKGDSLHKIAKLLGVNEEALKRENSSLEPRAMQIGTVLVVPCASGETHCQGRSPGG